jgi:hypothetical protein
MDVVILLLALVQFLLGLWVGWWLCRLSQNDS